MEKANSKPSSLPAINSPEGFGEGSLVAVRPETLSRMEYLEDRLTYQERTTRSMVERALMAKEDIIDSLNMAQVNWQGEKKARALLQEHIRTITSVVKRLSREIEVLEEEIRMKHGQVEGQTMAVKNLELHHVAGVTDLRGRVARCDTAIERLSLDTRNAAQSLNEHRLKVESSSKEVNERLQVLENNIQDIMRKLEKQSMEQSDSVQKVKGQASEQLVYLDSKTKTVVEDIRGNISANRRWTETEYAKLTQDFQARVGRLESIMMERQDKLEHRVDTYLKKIDQMLADEKDKYYNIWEIRLKETESKQERALSESCAHLRREYKEGFNTVHETMSSLQKVLTGKLKMVEDDLRKAINNVLRMVVVT